MQQQVELVRDDGILKRLSNNDVTDIEMSGGDDMNRRRGGRAPPTRRGINSTGGVGGRGNRGGGGSKANLRSGGGAGGGSSATGSGGASSGEFEQSKMNYDSTGMFHWCPSRDLNDSLMDRQEAAMTVLQVSRQ